MEDILASLAGIPLGAIRYFKKIGSTNDEAACWAEAGAPDFALVVANEQTAGRGRLHRRWYTPPGSALAFSLVLRDIAIASRDGNTNLARLTALGALAVCEALDSIYGLKAQIKWPNDVLVDGKKVAGILAEAAWQGENPGYAILGIGINVAPLSVPPAAEVRFPATCIEACLPGRLKNSGNVNRLELLRAVLEQLLMWRPRINTTDFLSAWEARLAYLKDWVYIYPDGTEEKQPIEGKVLGLASDGRLELCDRTGQLFRIVVGELHVQTTQASNSIAE